MRAKLGLLALVGVYVLWCGWRPDGLPFVHGAAFSDAAVAHYPSAFHLYQSLRQNSASLLWWELNMAGQPFAANPLNKTAYPLQWLAFLAPPALHLNLLVLLHFGIAAMGMWRWARSLNLSESAAMVAALAYALGPRFAAHTGAGHLDLLYAMAWWPWLMWSVREWSTQPPSIRTGLAIVVMAALILVADVRLSLFAYLTAASYGLVVIRGQPRRKLVLRTVFLLLPWTLLVAPVIVPLMLWQPYLSRASMTTAEAGALSLQPILLVGLFFPPPPTVDQEMLTYVGISVLILGAAAAANQPRKLLGWLLLLAFAVWYALGAYGGLWQVIVDTFPVLRWFRVPARAWLIVALLMPLLAGYGVQALTRRFKFRLLPAVVIGIVFVELAVFGHGWLEWRGEDDWLAPYASLAQYLRDEGADRVYSPTYSLPQQVAAAYGLSLFGGVDPFQLSGVNAAIAQGSGVDAPGYSVVQPPLVGGTTGDLSTANRDVTPDTIVLAAWQVSHLIVPYPITHPRLREVRLVGNIHVYRNLDYHLTLAPDRVPRWPESWSNLPDAEQVAALNTWTSIVAWAGAVLLVLILFVGSIFLTRKQ